MPVVAYPLAVVVAVAMKSIPYRPLLYSVGGIAAALCLSAITIRRRDAGFGPLVFSVSLFAVLAVCGEYLFLVAAGVAVWGVRGIVATNGRWTAFPAGRFALEWGVALILLAWGGIPLSASSAAAAFFLVAISWIVLARIRGLDAPFIGEIAACGVLAVVWGLDPANLAYLRNPGFVLGLALLTAFFFYQAGTFEKTTALLFSLSGTVVFSASGYELLAFYLLFTMIMRVGARIRVTPDGSRHSGGRMPGIFFPLSLGIIAISVLSVGADDPFPFYFAISGVMGAGVFHVWGGTDGEHPYTANNVMTGFSGASFLACSAWITSFLPASAAPLVLLSAPVALIVPVAAKMLAAPERDAKWLTIGAGGIFALLLAKALMPFFNLNG